MAFLQQEESVEEVSDPSFFDTDVLDQFEVPFGEWIDQSVDWIDTNLEWLLDTIKWPFDTLLGFLVGDILEPAPWWIIVLVMFGIGWLFRSFRVGLFALVALSFCGLLGPSYWLETARTIGFVAVAVLLCVLIGIPVGIACGRIDPVWSVVRPILDAMQVVHSFVYMLPFIFFFGIGEESATMVTMVFALPPLIRLTNLGIRQVPEDVVEASRAYGAPEFRVLTDVQIPLARPAIMTGVNQTLLLAISMLGIAAIMGAGGLGRLMFSALSGQDVARGASAGLAFFLVAVTLDRISQPVDGGDQASLLARMRAAWVHRADPESLLQDADALAKQEHAELNYGGHPAPVMKREGLGLKIAMSGAVLGLVSVFLTWGSDAGLITSHSRLTDVDLAGSSFNGLDAKGGSFFGFFVLIASVLVIIAGVTRLSRPNASRFLSADGATIAAGFGLGAALAYMWASPDDAVSGYSDGVGVYLAIIAMLIAVVGGVLSLSDAPYAPHRPVSQSIEWHKLFGALIAVLIIFAGSVSGWSFDQRDSSVVSAEDDARIQELRDQAAAIPAMTAQNAVEIAAIINSARRLDKAVHDGWTDRGAGLGPLVLLLGLIGAGTVVFSSGVFGSDQHKKWRWSVLSITMGAGVVAVAASWIATLARASEDGFISGVGAFLVLIGGLFLVASGRSLVSEFFRTEVFDDELELEISLPAPQAEESITEPVA